MKKITRKEMSTIKGGLFAPPPGGACCSVHCQDGKKHERECGSGVICTTNGSLICCGGDCINACSGVELW